MSKPINYRPKLWFLFLVVVICFNGAWTTNEFGYKPSLGARGATEKGYFDSALDRIDARLGKVVWVGDPKFGTTVQAAMTAIGTTNPTTLRIPTGAWAITADLTVPANVTLKPERGAVINIASTKTLTINGGLEAGLYRIFSCTGTGKVSFGAGVVKEVYPEWWGAKADGTTNDQPAIQLAVDSLPPYVGTSDNAAPVYTDGGKIKLSRGTYYVTSPMVLSNYHWLDGSGTSTVIKNGTDSSAAIAVGDGNTFVHRVRITNLSIKGSCTGVYVSGGYGIYAQKAIRCNFGPVWIYGTTDSGIRLKGSGYTYVENGSYIQSTSNYGIECSSLEGGADFWQTSTWIKDCTIRTNAQAGIVVRGSSTVRIKDNTIESNGLVGEQIGSAGHKSVTTYSMNVYLVGATYCGVENNYMEHSSAAAGTQVQTVLAHGYFNKVDKNDFVNYVGAILWSGKDAGGSVGTCNYNYINNNNFSGTAQCLQTLHEATVVPPNRNNFLNNTGMQWYDQDGNYTYNNASAGMFERAYQTVQAYSTASGTTYAPDFGYYAGAGIQYDGWPLGDIVQITLTDNITMSAPTNLPTSKEITYVFIQDGTGGRTVTFSSDYKVTWSDTGNTASKRSTIKFYKDESSNKLVQVGGQSPYN